MKHAQATYTDEPDHASDTPVTLADFRARLELDILNDLEELRGICTDSARAVKAQMAIDPDNLPTLNNAVVKAARAVRQIAVLQLDVAGIRQPAEPVPRQPAVTIRPQLSRCRVAPSLARMRSLSLGRV